MPLPRLTILTPLLVLVAVLRAADQPDDPQPRALPWQAQLNARPENLPPGERARPLFGRSTFVFAPRSPSADTNATAAKANPFILTLAPVPVARPPTNPQKNKPTLTEYRLELFGLNRKAPTPTPPAVTAPAVAPVAVAPAPPVAPRGEYLFAAVPPANPDLPFANSPAPRPGRVDYSNRPPAHAAAPASLAEPKPPPEKKAKSSAKSKAPAAAPPAPKLIVNADNGLGGTVTTADDSGRFVILNFPLGQMPRVDSTMTLYRHGVKTATLKITGPQRDDHIAADVLTGNPAEGDTAREE
jgi:hypothetical protein